MNTLLGCSYSDFLIFCKKRSYPSYVAKQLCNWIYKKRSTQWEQMTDLPLSMRHFLSENYLISRYKPLSVLSSKDGTRKYLFSLNPDNSYLGNSLIETVYIPDGKRKTICVSSQVGCRMGCRFCMTGTLGFKGNLTAPQILNQIYSVIDDNIGSEPNLDHWNVVFMGQGEPLDNIDNVLKVIDILTASWGGEWSPGRITVSTIGLSLPLRKILDTTKCNIAVSLHSPFSLERQTIMPAEHNHPIRESLDVLSKYDFRHQRHLSIEYILWKGFNDSTRHLDKLTTLAHSLNAHVNLISYHQTDVNKKNTLLNIANEEDLITFQRQLMRKGIVCTIRRSRGEDIWAACGMLACATITRN